MNVEFRAILHRWRIWYRLRRAVAWSAFGLISGLGLALGAWLLAIFHKSLLRGEFILLVLSVSLIATTAAILIALVWPLPTKRLTFYFDQTFHLKDRAVTALELMDKGWEEDHSAASLYQQQVQDAIRVSQSIQPSRRFFYAISRTQLWVIAVLAASIVAACVLGEPIFQIAAQRRAVQTAIQEEIEAIEALQSDLEVEDLLNEEQRRAITQKLEEAKEGLHSAQNLEQAVAILASTKEQLQKLSDSQAERLGEALQQAGNQLLQNQEGSSTPLQEVLTDLAAGNIQAAASALAAIDPENLSPSEAANLQEQLEKLAEALEGSNSQLAEELRQAAQALRDGNPQAAREALRQAAQSLANAGHQVAAAQTASQVAAQIGEGQGRLIQSGQSAQAQAGQGQSQGQGEPQGSGQAQGQGSSQQNGQGSGSSGAGHGEGNGDTGPGPEAGDTPIGQGNRPGDGGLKPYERIYAPQHIGGDGGEEVLLPGSGEEGELIGTTGSLPGEPGESSVPYSEVFPQYVEIYRQAVDNGEVPPLLLNVVRQYFSSLEP